MFRRSYGFCGTVFFCFSVIVVNILSDTPVAHLRDDLAQIADEKPRADH